jgi:hypothetical protein
MSCVAGAADFHRVARQQHPLVRAVRLMASRAAPFGGFFGMERFRVLEALVYLGMTGQADPALLARHETFDFGCMGRVASGA